MTGTMGGAHDAGWPHRREFLASAAALALAPTIAQAAPPVPGAIVETTSGKARGMDRNGVQVFKGVAYGAPTSGRGRFMAPTAPTPWSGVRDAFAFGHQSPQTMRFTEVLAPQAPPSEGYGEDCLVLNVWTPGPRRGAKRPVMFWCHGGGFFQESGSWPWVDGENLARHGDVVVVTMNHRLNAFGYLYLADIGGEKYAASGVAGMLDLVLALQWVRDNIDAFGGDPNTVMIFGESGGGAKVSTLLAMPAARGLFNKAAIQSGASLRGMTREDGDRMAHAFIRALDIAPNNLDALQALPFDRLLPALAPAQAALPPSPMGMRMGFSPVVDGHYLPTNPFDPVATSQAAGIPIIVGCNREEQSFFSLSTGDQAAFDLDEAGLRQRAATLVGDGRADELVGLYRRTHPNASPSELYFLMGTDRVMRKDSITLAERKVQQGAGSVHLYLFAWRSPALGGKLGAPHTVEIPFLFDNPDIPTVMTRGGPEVHTLARQVSGAWIAFARTGDPNHPGLDHWPAFDTTTRSTMVFDVDSRAESDPGAEERRFWASVSA